MLTFKEDTHQYFWDGVEVPGVSNILRTVGLSKDWKDVPPYYRDRGIAVHRAISLWLEGTLDEDSLDPVIVPYLDQFKDWLDTQKPFGGLVLSEKPFYSERLNFAGTMDLLMNKQIIDIKCSKTIDKEAQWQYRLQGSAYRTLAKENKLGDFPFKLLLLTGSGEPKFLDLTEPYESWEAVMSLYRRRIA